MKNRARKHSGARVLCLGAGALHRHHYEVIRSLGCHTIAIDRNPQAPSADAADEFYCADPGDADAVTEVARARQAAAIFPLSEFGVVPASVASHRLGLSQIDPDAARCATDKLAMRGAWKRHGIDQPEFAIAFSRAEAEGAARDLGYPLVVKPRSLTAAQGVRRIDGAPELAAYVEGFRHVFSSGLLLERYVEGIETSVEGLVVDGAAIVLAYADKELRPHPTFRVTRSINYPGAFTAGQRDAIHKSAVECVPALGLRNSPFHLEVFVAGERVVPIECAARIGGGHIGGLIVSLVSGVDLVGAAVRLLLGERPKVVAPKQPRGACYRFLFAPHGRLLDIGGVDLALTDSRVADIVISARPGDELAEPDAGVRRHGFIVTKGSDRNDAYAAADKAERSIHWQVEESIRWQVA